MFNIKVESNIDEFDMGKIPVDLDCPNKECGGKISFTLADLGAEKTIKCPTCGMNIKLENKKS